MYCVHDDRASMTVRDVVVEPSCMPTSLFMFIYDLYLAFGRFFLCSSHTGHRSSFRSMHKDGPHCAYPPLRSTRTSKVTKPKTCGPVAVLGTTRHARVHVDCREPPVYYRRASSSLGRVIQYRRDVCSPNMVVKVIQAGCGAARRPASMSPSPCSSVRPATSSCCCCCRCCIPLRFGAHGTALRNRYPSLRSQGRRRACRPRELPPLAPLEAVEREERDGLVLLRLVLSVQRGDALWRRVE